MNKIMDETVQRILNITKTPGIDQHGLILQELCGMILAGAHDSGLVNYARIVIELDTE